MGTTLDNGIYLPDEGERNCYEGLAGNWVALDNHLGSTNIHVTINDKQAWNGHVADTTIHVTAEDKSKWDAVTSKANDSDVVHKSGNETINGNKTFSSNVNVYNSDSSASTPNLYLRSSKIEISSQGNTSGEQNLVYLDKNNTVYAYIKGAIQSNGSAVKIRSTAKDSSDNSVICELQILAYTNGNKAIFPSYSNAIDLGVSNYKWKSFNGVEPSSLSLPSDRSARIDISSYFTNTGTGQSNSYTVPANGYIYLTLSELTNVHCFSRTSGNVTNYAQTFTKINNSTGTLYVLFPVRKNDVFVTTWYTTTTVSVDGAYFIPCQGNI